MPTGVSRATRLTLLVLVTCLALGSIGGTALGLTGPAGEVSDRAATPLDEGPESSDRDALDDGVGAAGGPLQLAGSNCDGTDEKPASKVSDRERVEDSTQYPYSAIGYVDTDDGYGTGFLVTDYHVITSAHVVSDGSGDPYSNVSFSPGYESEPHDAPNKRFGTAEVEDVTMPSSWGGGFDGDVDVPTNSIERFEFIKERFEDVDDAKNDVALLTLDQPIGAATGTMGFDMYSKGSIGDSLNPIDSAEYAGTWSQAGYPCGVEGDVMVSSQPESLGTIAGLHVFEPTNMMEGDSGSPIWHVEDGEPVAVSVTGWDGWAARFSSSRLELFEEQIASDSRPEAEAAVDVVGELGYRHPDWAGDDRNAPDTVSSHRQEVRLEATIYNEGYESSNYSDAPSTVPNWEDRTDMFPQVEFFVATDSASPRDSGLGTVCTDRGHPGVYDATTVGCTDTLDELEEVNLEDVDELYFYAEVTHESASDDHEPRLIGTADNEAESAGSPAVDVVDETAAADRPGFARDHFETPATVSDASEEIDLATTVYNEGLGDVPVAENPPIPPQAYAEVEFYATAVAPYGDSEVDLEDATQVCSDRVGVEKLDDAIADCSGDLEGAALSDPAHFYAYVDHSTAAEDHVPRYVGSADVETGSAELGRIRSVFAPDVVSPNANYTLSVTVANDADVQIFEAPVEATPSQGACTPQADRVSVAPGEEETVDVACSTPAEPGDGTVDVEVGVGPHSETTVVELSETDYTADVELEATDYQLHGVPDPEVNAVEVGDEYGLEATIENVGSEAGQRRLGFYSDAECANLDSDSVDPDLREFQDATVVDLEPGESTEVYFHCNVPLDGWLEENPSHRQASIWVQSAARVGNWHDVFPAEHPLNDFALVERAGPPSLSVEDVDAPEAATVGESVRVDPTVVNDGGPGNGSVRLLADGEVVDEARTYLGRYEAFPYLAFEYAPDGEDVGERTLTVETGDDSQSASIDVEPVPVEVAIQGVPEEVDPSAETVAVDLAVSNEGDQATTASVALVVDGSTVDQAAIDVDAGDATDATLEGAIPDDAGDALDVRVESEAAGSTDADAASVSVADGLECVAVGDAEVCDVNGDGEYRDVTGDGSVGQGDVGEFFGKQHRSAWKQPDLFDFSGNGEVTHGDVVELADYVALN